ncbi:MAG: hypothetical protein P8184_10695, partial [Calditrichia bacterium]
QILVVGAFPHHFGATIRTPFLLTGKAPSMGNLCATFGANTETTTAQPIPLVGLHFSLLHLYIDEEFVAHIFSGK